MLSLRSRPRASLFWKYLLILFIAVAVPLLGSGANEAWFGYRDQRAMMNDRLQVEAASAAARIEGFLHGIEGQLGWTVQQAWSERSAEQHRLSALGVLRQVPAVISITLVDGDGIERLYVSRIELERRSSGIDRSADAPVAGARSSRVWHGPVTYFQDSEPFMTIAVAGNRRAAGISVAEINLKLIWDVILAIRIGETGHAFVVDESGRLIAHPDIGRVLRGADQSILASIRDLRAAARTTGGTAVTENLDGERAVVAVAAIPGLAWEVFVEQPLAEAFAPIRYALWRTGMLLLVGTALAALLALLLARRMTGPIRVLEKGAERIGAGDFQHRLTIASGDEFERLADRFNRMAEELAVSKDRSERIARLRQFLAPQVAELVESAGSEALLAGQRVEVVVVFCDLRGFTAFSSEASPDEIMHVLGQYYGALGSVIERNEATLTNFFGDGLMVLLNAPISCEDPAGRAVAMALGMQQSIQSLAAGWRSRGYAIGFGVGAAMGPATVGRVGTESRVEYTAIGSVVNLASRLCGIASDGEILVDQNIADAVLDRFPLLSLGPRPVKGFDTAVPIHAVANGPEMAAAGA